MGAQDQCRIPGSDVAAQPAALVKIVGKGLSAGKTATDRKEAQVAKNLDTQRRQSPSMKDAGMDSDKAGIKDKIDVSKLTPEEFAALPEATKAKLRGDVL